MTAGHLTASQRQHLRTLLLRARKDWAQRIKRIEEQGLHRSLRESTGELSTYDNHPADLGDETFARGQDVGLRDLLRRRLEQADRAWERMQSGLYGFCEDCGGPIPFARLLAAPHTTRCLPCQRQQESETGSARPIEEDRLHRSWAGLFDVGTADDQGAGQREDVWQAVEQYGTSDTPQDQPDMAGYEHPYLHAGERVGSVEPVETQSARRRDPEDRLGHRAIRRYPK